MDLVTQGLLGATLAQSAAAKNVRAATAVGFAAGLLPDADGLIRTDSDPLLFLEFHRHFTHALIFVPIGAAVATLLLWPFFRQTLALKQLYLFAFLGYALAGVLDACTSYGTHLFWPFSDQPVAWGIVSIIDPLFSLILLAGLGIGFYRRRHLAARVALMLTGAYLLVGVLQHERAESIAQKIATDRGHQAEKLLVKPTIGNLVLWRSLYLADGRLYASAVRPALAGPQRVYPGEDATLLLPSNTDQFAAQGFRPNDVTRFARFADGLLVQHPNRPAMIGDARFAMLPTQLRPLWGIEPRDSDDETGVDFVTDRTLSDAERRQFVDMLLGRPLGEETR